MRAIGLPRGAALSAVCAAFVGLLAPGTDAFAAGCPNEAIRAEQGTTGLPYCMGLEMVSPPQKDNYRAGEPTNSASISADGSRVLFESPAALAETEGLLNPLGDSYVATRGVGGWTSLATSPPAPLGFGYAGASSAGLPLSLTPAFDKWFSLQNTITQAQNGQMTAYEASLGGSWTARSPLLVPLDGHHGLQLIREITRNAFTGASSDRSHYFMRPADALADDSNGLAAFNGYSTTYLPGDPQPRRLDSLSTTAATWNTYVLTRDGTGQPVVALLARDSDGKAWGGNCGAFVGGGGRAGTSGGRNQGAVSGDGTSVLFSTRPLQPEPNAAAPTYPRCAESGAATFVAGAATIPSVITAKGLGTTSESVEPEVVRGVTTTTGSFAVGQTVTLTGSTIAAGTTITAIEAETETRQKITLSNPVTAGGGEGKELKAGAQPFAVGEEVSATTTCTIPGPAGPCFAPGTTITAVNGQSITVSPAPLKTGPGKTIVAIPPLRIMQRDEAANGDATITELLGGGPAAGNDFFEGASADQDRIYFTSSRNLAGSDLDPSAEECSYEVELPTPTSQGCDLYLYEKLPAGGHEVIQVSAGGSGDPTPGEGADVYRGVTAISQDGSHVYFAAQGVLTTDPNPEGAVAESGKLNLYLYERDDAHPSGLTSFVGGLDSTCALVGSIAPDCASVVGNERSYGNAANAVPFSGAGGSGGDGHLLVFQSTAPLTADDQDGHHLDVFRYDPEAATLACVSCRPGGADAEPFDVAERALTGGAVSSGLAFAERQSWTSEDGGAIVFSTEEQLLPEDQDGGRSDYLWREGALSLLPGTGRRPAVSHDGLSVVFETPVPLLPQDGDTAVDVYMARIGGGFPNPPLPQPGCQGEACQGPLSPLPGAGSASTESFQGQGNVSAKQPSKKHKKRHKKKHKKHKKKHGKKKKGRHARHGARANRGGRK